MKQIPVFKPLIEKEEIDAAIESLKMGWLGMGSYVKEFEERIEKICNIKNNSDRFVVAVSTGHAALHLSLLMMGIKEGDEVITPAFNNAADFQAIKACGANPVFVDIKEDTLCIDPSKIEKLITSKTKAIIVMDYDMFLCEHDEIKKISNKYKIPVLHDAAHSFGSSYKGKMIGNQHDYTIFSFDPVKTITCIDGGAIVVNESANVEKLHAKRLIGMTQSAQRMYKNTRAWEYDINEIGFRYHLANLHAAIGIQQLKKINEIKESRQKACKNYHSNLKDLPWLIAPFGDIESVNPFLYYVRILEGSRDSFRNYLRKNNIDTGIHWTSGHNFSLFKNCKKGDLGVRNKISNEIVSLPLHTNMNFSDQEHIIQTIKNFK